MTACPPGSPGSGEYRDRGGQRGGQALPVPAAPCGGFSVSLLRVWVSRCSRQPEVGAQRAGGRGSSAGRTVSSGKATHPPPSSLRVPATFSAHAESLEEFPCAPRWGCRCCSLQARRCSPRLPRRSVPRRCRCCAVVRRCNGDTPLCLGVGAPGGCPGNCGKKSFLSRVEFCDLLSPRWGGRGNVSCCPC